MAKSRLHCDKIFDMLSTDQVLDFCLSVRFLESNMFREDGYIF